MLVSIFVHICTIFSCIMLNNYTMLGSVHVYHPVSTNSWTEVVRVVADDAVAGDLFGYSVALHGSQFVVGARGKSFAANSMGMCGVSCILWIVYKMTIFS